MRSKQNRSMIKRKGAIPWAKVQISTIHKREVGHYVQCKRLRTGGGVPQGIENLLPFYIRHKWRTLWDEYILN